MNEIKKFLQTKETPILSVEANKETAGRLAVKFVGWDIDSDLFYVPVTGDDLGNIPQRFAWVARKLDLTHKLEKAVIEKYADTEGVWRYQRHLQGVVQNGRYSYHNYEVARANALQRLTACLLTIAESEESK